MEINEIVLTVSHFVIGHALRVKDYSYRNRRRKHKSETCFNFAMTGCDIHVEIGKKLPKSTAEPKLRLAIYNLMKC